MQKQTVIFEENPKWQIYKGKCFCQIGPLSRDRARIPYLIILCPKPTSQEPESQLTEQARAQEEKEKNQDIQEMVAESINQPGVEVDEQENGQPAVVASAETVAQTENQSDREPVADLAKWIQEHPENKG